MLLPTVSSTNLAKSLNPGLENHQPLNLYTKSNAIVERRFILRDASRDCGLNYLVMHIPTNRPVHHQHQIAGGSWYASSGCWHVSNNSLDMWDDAPLQNGQKATPSESHTNLLKWGKTRKFLHFMYRVQHTWWSIARGCYRRHLPITTHPG